MARRNGMGCVGSFLLLAGLGFAGVCGLLAIANRDLPPDAPTADEPESKFTPPALRKSAGKVTRENFNRIRTGMSRDEVFALLGPGDVASEVGIDGHRTVVYVWRSGFSNCNVTIQNGQVVAKAQAGL